MFVLQLNGPEEEGKESNPICKSLQRQRQLEQPHNEQANKSEQTFTQFASHIITPKTSHLSATFVRLSAAFNQKPRVPIRRSVPLFAYLSQLRLNLGQWLQRNSLKFNSLKCFFGQFLLSGATNKQLLRLIPSKLDMKVKVRNQTVLRQNSKSLWGGFRRRV